MKYDWMALIGCILLFGPSTANHNVEAREVDSPEDVTASTSENVVPEGDSEWDIFASQKEQAVVEVRTTLDLKFALLKHEQTIKVTDKDLAAKIVAIHGVSILMLTAALVIISGAVAFAIISAGTGAGLSAATSAGVTSLIGLAATLALVELYYTFRDTKPIKELRANYVITSRDDTSITLKRIK